jgi:hypothetical protein
LFFYAWWIYDGAGNFSVVDERALRKNYAKDN